jgi:hypothetical protein
LGWGYQPQPAKTYAKAGSQGGKFCRNGINCRVRRGIGATENPRFIGFLAMARRLLIP